MAEQRRRRRRQKTGRPVSRRNKAVPKVAPAPVVSVIILNYNTKKLTVDCLQSLAVAADEVPFEVIVVDNASTDGSAAWLRRRLPANGQLVELARNIGFGPGNNVGAQKARGDYLFFINSDTLLLPHCISQLVSFADSAPQYGIVAPRVMLKDGKTVQAASYGRLPTLINTVTRTGPNRKYSVQQNQPVVINTEWVTGAALLIPRELFAGVGGFDSRFFMYFEDQDLAASVREWGYAVGVVNDAGIIHLGGRSSPSNQKRYDYYDTSQRLFFAKHRGWLATALLLLLRWPWKLIRHYR